MIRTSIRIRPSCRCVVVLAGLLLSVVNSDMATAGTSAPTTTVISSATNPSLVTNAVTFTATITPADATGTVAFMQNGAVIASCAAQPITAGEATCAYTFGAVGSFAMSATYSGDLGHIGSTSPALTQVVDLIPTATTLSAMGNPVSACCPFIINVIVTPAAAPFTYGSYSLTLNGHPYTGFFNGEGGPGQLFNSFIPGVYTFVAHYNGAGNYAPSDSAPLTITVTDTSPRRQYFAEGATGGFFHTTIGILNTSVGGYIFTVNFYPESGTPTSMDISMSGLTRKTLDLNQLLGPVSGVSTLVSACCSDVVATRRMTWGNPVYGSTLQSGSTFSSSTWYFAEGATNVFSLFYLVQNPYDVPANVTLTHLLEGGGPPVIEHEVVPANSRRTFNINGVPGLAAAAFSTVITSDVQVVAERAMYLNTSDRLWEGGTAGRGATQLSTNWSFAEGATGFFHTYLLLGNPGTTDGTATVRYQLADGTVISKDYPVAAQSRRTIDVAGEDPQLQAATFGMSVSSTVPIVAERAMWWGLPFYEGSVALGTTSAGTRWAIGEGIEGGPNGDATFVLVSNGSATQGTVRFTLVYDDGTNETKDYTLLANARLTVRIADDFVKARDAAFSVIVESLTAGVPITVESAQYQNTTRFLEGGDTAFATRLQ
jgi:hypothetical protein